MTKGRVVAPFEGGLLRVEWEWVDELALEMRLTEISSGETREVVFTSARMIDDGVQVTIERGTYRQVDVISVTPMSDECSKCTIAKAAAGAAILGCGIAGAFSPPAGIACGVIAAATQEIICRQPCGEEEPPADCNVSTSGAQCAEPCTPGLVEGQPKACSPAAVPLDFTVYAVTPVGAFSVNGWVDAREGLMYGIEPTVDGSPNDLGETNAGVSITEQQGGCSAEQPVYEGAAVWADVRMTSVAYGFEIVEIRPGGLSRCIDEGS